MKKKQTNLHSKYVCRQSRQTKVKPITHTECFFKIWWYCLKPNTISQIRGYSNTVFSLHSNQCWSIIFQDALKQKMKWHLKLVTLISFASLRGIDFIIFILHIFNWLLFVLVCLRLQLQHCGMVVITIVQLLSLKSQIQVLCKFKSCLWPVRDLRRWGSLKMISTGNKTKSFLLIIDSTKTIHHQFIIISDNWC